jgi:hypothetical protein
LFKGTPRAVPDTGATDHCPSVSPGWQEVMMIDVDWRQPFIDYLSE